MFVIWNASPIAWGFPSSPVKATAKSLLSVIVQREVPSPCGTEVPTDLDTVDLAVASDHLPVIVKVEIE